MLEGRLPSGPGPPAMNFVSSGDPSNRGPVGRAAQCAAPPARYRPRSSPSRAATFGEAGTVRGGTGILSERGGTLARMGFTLFRYAGSASGSAAPLFARAFYG